PRAMANTAGSTPRRTSTTHQAMARRRSAFGRTPKNLHSLRSRRRDNTNHCLRHFTAHGKPRTSGASSLSTPPLIGSLDKPLIVRRWPVNRRNRLIVESQIHGQLAPMMGEMVERVAKRNMPRGFHDDLPPDKQPPRRRHEEIVVRLG